MCTENQAIMKYDAKSYPIDPNVITLVKNVINLKSLFNPTMNKYGILLKNVMNNVIKKETYKDIFNMTLVLGIINQSRFFFIILKFFDELSTR